MTPYEAIETMSCHTGLDFGRIEVLASLKPGYIQQMAELGIDTKLDIFAHIVELCGYTLTARYADKTIRIKADVSEFASADDVHPSSSIDGMLTLSGKTSREVSRVLGRGDRYLAGLIARHSVPHMSSFLAIADATGIEICVRRFLESYRIDLREELQKLDEPLVGVEGVARATIPSPRAASGEDVGATSLWEIFHGLHR